MISSSLSTACDLLKSGKPVAFPTETVYGLGANAENDMAVAQVFALKHRPSFNPLIVHYSSVAAMEKDVVLCPLAYQLADRFWPGPLTLVVPWRTTSAISSLVRAGGDTLAVRIPRHSVALELLRQCPFPLAAPSANRSGFLSPTTAFHVQEDLGDSVSLILEGGSCEVGLESTIIDLTTPVPTLLRPGGMAQEDLSSFLSLNVKEETTRAASSRPLFLKAPGQLESHYAPRHPVRLEAKTATELEGFLTFGPPPPHEARVVYHLSETGNLLEGAANLFKMLHLLDEAPIKSIAVMPIPEEGLGRAMNDRLRRAAAEKDSRGGGAGFFS